MDFVDRFFPGRDKAKLSELGPYLDRVPQLRYVILQALLRVVEPVMA
jgi:hypothetical protein